MRTRKFLLSLIVILILTLANAGCGPGNGRSNPFSIDEVLVPGAASFPTGNTDTGRCATVNYPYYMAKYEVTYQLWSTVYTWAVNHGYTFANPGNRGGARNFGLSQTVVYTSGHETDPVSTINWRDAIVWCNALTEYYNVRNSTSLGCVYKSGNTPLRDATAASICDAVIPDGNAYGFRLPGSMEWELAARYRGNDSTNAFWLVKLTGPMVIPEAGQPPASKMRPRRKR